jgi:hypothetical protein
MTVTESHLGVEELDELTVPILGGLLQSVLNLVLGLLGGLLG